MGIKIEVLKNEYETLNKDGYRIHPGYYYVINAISNEVLFSSQDFGEAHRFKSNILYSYKYMGEKTLVLACSEQFFQAGKIDPVVFLVDKSASKYSGGFNWDDSILGRSFLGKCIA